MNKLAASMAFLFLAGAFPQNSPPLYTTPPEKTKADDPEFWKNIDFFAEGRNKALPNSQPPASLPPDGDRDWSHKDYLAAAIEYRRQADLTPDAPEPWYNAALSYHRHGWRTEALNALDKAEAVAHGSLRARCLLLRADLEYRDALSKERFARIAGLGSALQMYRDVLASPDTNSWIAGLAKYDVEVVKLRLLLRPPTGSPAPNAESDNALSADDAAGANSAQKPPKPQDKAAQPKDW